jgi:hypothetical protein
MGLKCFPRQRDQRQNRNNAPVYNAMGIGLDRFVGTLPAK